MPVPPDAGSRPVAGGGVPTRAAVLPRPAHLRTTAAPKAAAVPADPMLAGIQREQAAVEKLSEQLNEATAELDRRRAAQKAAADALAAATVLRDEAQALADKWARDAFIDAAESPLGFPFAPPADDAAEAEQGDDPLVDRLTVANGTYLEAERAAQLADAALATQEKAVADLRKQLTTRGAALETLKATYAEKLAEAERLRDLRNSALAAQYLRDADARPGSAAYQAVRYALRQLGKPYEWGAEGPDTFDCSGLAQTAYATAGISLPRTARPQYRATPTVPVSALLPGDLLFFATDKSNWDTIHHMGIYLGRGQMVHAPTTGDVVKISPIWWEEFFAATRVVPGRPGKAEPMTPPKQSARPAPSKSAKPKPSPSKRSRSRPAPSPSGSGSGSGSGSPSPSPSNSSPSPLLPGVIPLAASDSTRTTSTANTSAPPDPSCAVTSRWFLSPDTTILVAGPGTSCTTTSTLV